jgi:hypothetical protein
LNKKIFIAAQNQSAAAQASEDGDIQVNGDLL